MRLTGQNYIVGSTSAAGSETFYSVNPRSKAADDLPFHNATEAEVNRAVDAAMVAFKEVRHYSSEKIAGFLVEVAAQIEAIGDELLDTADRETGLGLPRLTGERARTTGQFRAFAAFLRDGNYLRPIISSAQPGQPFHPSDAVSGGSGRGIRREQFPLCFCCPRRRYRFRIGSGLPGGG